MKKLLFVLFLFISSACNSESNTNGLSYGVTKFNDGNVQCYVLFQNAISCVNH